MIIEVKVVKIVKNILHLFGWAIVIIWLAIIGFDFYQVSNKNEPKLCIKNEIKEYNDGNMHICTGLGYKVYNSTRDSVRFEYLFGPFWTKEPMPSK